MRYFLLRVCTHAQCGLHRVLCSVELVIDWIVVSCFMSIVPQTSQWTPLPRVVSNDITDASWDRLFKFCSQCLRVPKRGGHRSLAREVNHMIRDEVDPPMPTQSGNPHSRPVRDPLKSLAAQVSSKLEE